MICFPGCLFRFASNMITEHPAPISQPRNDKQQPNQFSVLRIIFPERLFSCTSSIMKGRSKSIDYCDFRVLGQGPRCQDKVVRTEQGTSRVSRHYFAIIVYDKNILRAAISSWDFFVWIYVDEKQKKKQSRFLNELYFTSETFWAQCNTKYTSYSSNSLLHHTRVI